MGEKTKRDGQPPWRGQAFALKAFGWIEGV
jgi:hypothetical protein